MGGQRGAYFCRVSNNYGQVNSQVANIYVYSMFLTSNSIYLSVEISKK